MSEVLERAFDTADKSNWQIKTLGEACRTSSGGTPSRSRPDYFNGSIPWVKSGELTDGLVSEVSEFISEEALAGSSAKLLPAGTLLIAMYGATVGKLGVLARAAATNQAVCAIFPPPELDPKFLFWYLRSQRSNLIAKAVGGAQPNISQTILRDLELPIPPIGEQREIVAELEKQFSRLDEAVANLQRVKANLKRYKDSVYSEAFSNAPNSTLGELIEVGPQNGLYLPKDMYGDGVPILRIDDYQTAWIRPVQELRRVNATQEQISTWTLCEDDLVVNRVNSMTHLGKCVRIPKSLAGTVFESNMMRMRLTAAASPKYVEHYLASRLGKKRLTGNAKWAVNQASINQKDVRATPIFVPDLAAQLALVTEIDRQLSIVREVEADTNLQRAQALRQSVLSRAFLESVK